MFNGRITSRAKIDVKEKRRKAILKKVRRTAASNPTICRMTSSGVLIVGRIHEKNVLCKCASCGENPLSFVRGAKRTGQRVRQYENKRNETIPIDAESTSCVLSQGPEYLIVGGEPGGAAGVSMSNEDSSLMRTAFVYNVQYDSIAQ